MNISKDNLIEYYGDAIKPRLPVTGSPIIVVDGYPFTVLPKSHVSLTSNESVWNTVDTTTIKHGTPCIAIGNKVIPLLPKGYLSGSRIYYTTSFDLEVNDGVPEGSISYDYEFYNKYEMVTGSGTLVFHSLYDGDNGFLFYNTKDELFFQKDAGSGIITEVPASAGRVCLRQDVHKCVFEVGTGGWSEGVQTDAVLNRIVNGVTILNIPAQIYTEEKVLTADGDVDYVNTISVDFHPNY